jgi:Family of unknown function (DUF6308)
MFKLADGTVKYRDEDALTTVCKYAFDVGALNPKRRYKGTFPEESVPMYAYRTYDCIPASSGSSFSDLDLLVTAGLNARIDMRAVARLRSFADRAAGDLDTAHRMQPDFRKLLRSEVGNQPPNGSAGWYLRRAWQHGMATPELGIARVHKTLHHKHPALFPILDNETLQPINAAAGDRNAWEVIWDEFQVHSAQFKWLAANFDQQALDYCGVSLSWLRLYDILIWMHVMGHR